ncbi:MAG: CHRD domain-containing protein [Nitrosomonas sp.]|nr:MAG: CHRD domain-containing protein [Nitrosomonas sp.]
MKKTTLLAAAIAGFSFSGAAMAEVFAFIEMPLTTSQEAVISPAPTPAPNSNGHGRITAFYDNLTKVLTYNVNWKLEDGAVPRAHETGNNHIHGPAEVGTAAAIVISLPDLPPTNSGNVSGSVVLTAGQASAIETGLAEGRMYYNIHSTLFGGGEIRAQLIPNGASATGVVFQNSELTLSNVLVPGIAGAQVYDAVLNFTNGTFVLTTATPVR